MALKTIQDFVRYWYFRYLLVTELYMVEIWERVTIHVLFLSFFVMFYYFNYAIILRASNAILGKDSNPSYVIMGHDSPNIS